MLPRYDNSVPTTLPHIMHRVDLKSWYHILGPIHIPASVQGMNGNLPKSNRWTGKCLS
jgi:hypothetical protein